MFYGNMYLHFRPKIPEKEKNTIKNQPTSNGRYINRLLLEVQYADTNFNPSAVEEVESSNGERINIQNKADSQDSDYKAVTCITHNQMGHRLPNFAENCDRYQVCNRAAASIALSILKDLNIITPIVIRNISWTKAT
jgi:hypothetical protein